MHKRMRVPQVDGDSTRHARTSSTSTQLPAHQDRQAVRRDVDRDRTRNGLPDRRPRRTTMRRLAARARVTLAFAAATVTCSPRSRVLPVVGCRANWTPRSTRACAPGPPTSARAPSPLDIALKTAATVLEYRATLETVALEHKRIVALAETLLALALAFEARGRSSRSGCNQAQDVIQILPTRT